MENKKPSSLNSVLLCLCNLNGIGLGYLLAGLKKRWMVMFGANLALVLAAYFSGAYKNPILWAVIFIALYIGMTLDLWFMLKKDPGRIPALKPYLLPAAALLINLVFYGGFFIYQSAGNQAIAAGTQAYMEKNYESAYEQLNSAAGIYRFSFNSDYAKVQDELGEISLVKLCREQAASGQYEAVIESVDQFQVQYPDSAYLSSVNETAVDAVLAWSQDLQQAGNYEDSTANLIALRTNFADQYRRRKVEIDGAIADSYYLWGQAFMDDGDYEQAIAKFEEAVNIDADLATTNQAYQAAAGAYLASATAKAAANDYETACGQLDYLKTHYASSDVYEEALSKLPEMVLDWGNYLRDQSSFLSAMEKYELASQMTEDEGELAAIEAESQKNIALLAADSGPDGRAVMIETLTDFCNKGWMDDFYVNPAIDYFPDQAGKALSCGNSPYLPDDLVADTPGSFRYVISFFTNADMEEYDIPLETCTYEGGYSLERYMKWIFVSVNKTNTSELTYEGDTFFGSEPSPCPKERYFNSQTEKLYGGDWDMAEIEAWLRGVLK
jgi:tetratricopeptide (TPR) repeat protein